MESLWNSLAASSVFAVFHWDADGIASAAILLKMLGERIVGFYPPKVGVYSLEALPWRRISESRASVLAVLDYGLPGTVYEDLSDIVAPRSVAVLDHHLVEPPGGGRRGVLHYVNPVAQGLGGEEDWPATSFLVYSIPGVGEACDARRCSWLAAVGIVGDLGPVIEARPRVYGTAARLTGKSGYSLRDIAKVVELIDSCYRLLDEECIVHAAQLLGWASGPRDVLDDNRLSRAAEEAAKALRTAMDRVRYLFQRHGIIAYYVESDAYVTSYVGRKLAAMHSDSVVLLLHWAPGRKRGFVYARSMRYQLTRVLRELRESGVPAGGKEHVLAFPVEEPDKGLLEKLADLVERHVYGKPSADGGSRGSEKERSMRL